jgi:hypothetical protein
MRGRYSRGENRHYFVAFLAAPPVRPFSFLHLFHFSSIFLTLLSCFKSTVTMKKNDPMLAYACNIVKLSDFNNSEIRRAALPRTEGD